VVAALILRDAESGTEVLVCQRKPDQPMSLKWEFPGGKIEPGETPEGALIRELKEELDIDVAAKCLAPLSFASHSYPEFHLLMPLFVCRRWDGDIAPQQGQELAWVRAQKLADYATPPADEPLKVVLRDLL
jgi:8-oxo-dGTP diphosphatase